MARTLRHEPEGMRYRCASYGKGDVTLSGYEDTRYGEEGAYKVTTGYEVCIAFVGPTYYGNYADASAAFDAAVRAARAAKSAA